MSERTTKCCIALFALLLVSLCIAGCTTQQSPNGTAATVTSASNATAQELLVATTTSLYDTGLLDYLAPIYEKQYNTHLKCR